MVISYLNLLNSDVHPPVNVRMLKMFKKMCTAEVTMNEVYSRVSRDISNFEDKNLDKKAKKLAIHTSQDGGQIADKTVLFISTDKLQPLAG